MGAMNFTPTGNKMMTRQELIKYITIIVSALLETDGSPESSLYMFVDMDIHKWETIRNALIGGGLITIKANFVKLTDKGEELAKAVDAELAKLTKTPT